MARHFSDAEGGRIMEWRNEISEFWLRLLWFAIDVYEFPGWVGEKILDYIIEIPFRLIGLGIEISLFYDKVRDFFRKRKGLK